MSEEKQPSLTEGRDVSTEDGRATLKMEPYFVRRSAGAPEHKS
jgi:hypothetical protein